MTRFVIIGAGVAGLAAANVLVDKGFAPTIIDASEPAKPKVCGEFFSPEVVELLERWGVPLIYKKRAILHTAAASFTFEFDKPAASVSRPVVEAHLAQRAVRLGATLLTNTSVSILHKPSNEAHETDEYRLGLVTKRPEETDTYAEIIADSLLVAAGRFFNVSTEKGTAKKSPKYIGIKGYFSGVSTSSIALKLDELHMFINQWGYAGMMYVDADTVSICCLADAAAVAEQGGPEKFIGQFLSKFHGLYELYSSGTILYGGWLTVPVFGFGKKDLPEWPGAYFIGDAAAGIYPASGNGLAMGITSAIMAVDYALHSDASGYRKAWGNRYSDRLYYAQLLHFLFRHPALCTVGFPVSRIFPVIARKLYAATRD